MSVVRHFLSGQSEFLCVPSFGSLFVVFMHVCVCVFVVFSGSGVAPKRRSGPLSNIFGGGGGGAGGLPPPVMGSPSAAAAAGSATPAAGEQSQSGTTRHGRPRSMAGALNIGGTCQEYLDLVWMVALRCVYQGPSVVGQNIGSELN